MDDANLLHIYKKKKMRMTATGEKDMYERMLTRRKK